MQRGGGGAGPALGARRVEEEVKKGVGVSLRAGAREQRRAGEEMRELQDSMGFLFLYTRHIYPLNLEHGTKKNHFN